MSGLTSRKVRCPECGRGVRVMTPKGTSEQTILEAARCPSGQHQAKQTGMLNPLKAAKRK